MIGEGEWQDFSKSEIYRNKKLADKISYLWDKLIQKTSQNTLDGTLLGDSTPLRGQSAIHEMAKEPRFSRRALSEHISQAIRNFPESSKPIMRNLSYMPSFYEGTGYVFLQLKVEGVTVSDNDYRQNRQTMLEIACGAAKNKFEHLKKVIGIAIDAPKYSKTNAEDFILMDCTNWTSDLRKYYEKANEGLDFFKSDSLTIQEKTVKNFPDIIKPMETPRAKIGRNEPCPCGSGKKFKKCCIDIRTK